MKKGLAIGALALAFIGIVALTNFAQLQRPLDRVLESDVRNKGISARAHFKSYLVLNTVVFDLRRVSGDSSQADVFRVVLQYADALKKKNFSRLVFAYSGDEKFYIEGTYFNTLGTEYNFQNPVFTMRSFPGHVFNIDGSKAFGSWSGGLIGVLSKQIEDFSEFHKRWYLEDFIEEM